MQNYPLVFKLSLSDILQNRVDFFLHTFKYATAVVMMSLVWLAVIKEQPQGLFSPSETVRYYVFAAILYSLSNFHTWYVEDDIKTGGLTKHILKPVNIFLYYFSYQTAYSGFEMFLKAVVLPPLLFILGFQLTFSLTSFVIFLLYLPVIYFFSLCLMMTISFGAFWFKEVYAIRWSLLILFRFLSGILVPLSFFPNWFQSVSFYLPFQYLAFVPIQIIQEKVSAGYAIEGLVILCGWAVVMFLANRWVWSKALYAYEGGSL